MVPYHDCWLSGLMWDGLVPGVPASCITVFQQHMREKTCTLVFSQKCMDALIHCQVKLCLSFKKHLWDSFNQRNDWGEIEDELMTLSNNTGGRSTPTHCKIYSQWEQENETQLYGCLCRIPSSLISLEPLFGCCTEKKTCQSSQRRKCNFPQGLCSMCCWLTNNQLGVWHPCTTNLRITLVVVFPLS